MGKLTLKTRRSLSTKILAYYVSESDYATAHYVQRNQIQFFLQNMGLVVALVKTLKYLECIHIMKWSGGNLPNVGGRG